MSEAGVVSVQMMNKQHSVQRRLTACVLQVLSPHLSNRQAQDFCHDITMNCLFTYTLMTAYAAMTECILEHNVSSRFERFGSMQW